MGFWLEPHDSAPPHFAPTCQESYCDWNGKSGVFMYGAVCSANMHFHAEPSGACAAMQSALTPDVQFCCSKTHRRSEW